MAKEDTKFDVAVIGGGPAGIMAAIQAASPEHGRRVVLIEKNSSLAKKLLLSGGGRCNLSNAEFNLRKIIMGYNNGEFLFHAFSVFGPKKIIEPYFLVPRLRMLLKREKISVNLSWQTLRQAQGGSVKSLPVNIF